MYFMDRLILLKSKRVLHEILEAINPFMIHEDVIEYLEIPVKYSHDIEFSFGDVVQSHFGCNNFQTFDGTHARDVISKEGKLCSDSNKYNKELSENNIEVFKNSISWYFKHHPNAFNTPLIIDEFTEYKLDQIKIVELLKNAY